MSMTKSDFAKLADILSLKANGAVANGGTKLFSTGSVGFNVSTKVQVVIPKDIPKSEWETKAPPLMVEIGGVPIMAQPMLFSTGSFGYNVNGKVSKVLSNGELVKLQISCNPCVPKSKELDVVEAGIVPLQVTVNATAIKSKEWAS